MNPKERESLKDDALLDGDGEIGGIAIRPFSFGSLITARKLKLSLFDDSVDEESITDAEEERQLVAFIWMQSKPPREVVRAIRQGTAEEEIEVFAHELDLTITPQIVAEVQRIGAMAKASAFEAIPRHEPSDKDEAPGKS